LRHLRHRFFDSPVVVIEIGQFITELKITVVLHPIESVLPDKRIVVIDKIEGGVQAVAEEPAQPIMANQLMEDHPLGVLYRGDIGTNEVYLAVVENSLGIL